jgi:uroporphyrinogen-III synthase
MEEAQRRGYEWDFVSSAKSPKNFWHFFTECRLSELKETPYLEISNIHSRTLITAVLQIIFFNQYYYILTRSSTALFLRLTVAYS